MGHCKFGMPAAMLLLIVVYEILVLPPLYGRMAAFAAAMLFPVSVILVWAAPAVSGKTALLAGSGVLAAAALIVLLIYGIFPRAGTVSLGTVTVESSHALRIRLAAGACYVAAVMAWLLLRVGRKRKNR